MVSPALAADVSGIDSATLVLVYFKNTIMLGGYKPWPVTSEATDSFFSGLKARAAASGASFFLVPSADKKGFLVSEGRPASDTVRLAQAEHSVLSACSVELARTAPKVALEFRKKIVRNHVPRYVHEDDIAWVLKALHFAVVERKGKFSFVVVHTAAGSVDEAVQFISKHPIVKSASKI